MRTRAFSVLDAKAKAFLPPFFYGEVGQATRMFADLVNRKDHMFAAHPEDFVLYEIGLFDDSKALLEPFGPEMIVTALHVVKGVSQGNQIDLIDQAKVDGHTGIGLD